MPIHLDLRKVDRLTALNSWLRYHQIGRNELARRLGVDPSFITYLFQGKRRSRRVIEALIALGMPRSLLPDPGRGPGRPRTRQDDEACQGQPL